MPDITESNAAPIAAATENGVLADLAATAAAVEVTYLTAELIPDFAAVSLPVGRRYTIVDLEQYQPHPRQRTATVRVEDPESLASYIVRHKTAATTVWADRRRGTVTAILDDHRGEADDGTPGWGQHRATLILTTTEDWAHWARLDGKLVGQLDFAEHLDDGAAAIVDPPAADMIALAQSFSAKRNVNFMSAALMQSGDVSLGYEETTAARAGVKGAIEIPQTLTLQLAPWEGCTEYEVLARFRYRLSDKGLLLGYRLIRPDRVLRDAFGAVLAQIRDQTGLVPYLGVR